MAAFDLDAVKILGVGDCVLDYLFRSPAPARGDAIRVSDYKTEGGGLTATAVVACARLGCAAALVCRLGCDEIAEAIVRELVSEGVETGGIIRVEGCRSPVSFIHVDQDTGDRTIFYFRDAMLEHPAALAEWGTSGVDCLLVDDTWLPAAISAATEARKSGIPVVADLAPSGSNAPLLRVVDILIAPSSFGDRYAVNGDYTPALEEIHRLGPTTAVVTAGKRGSWYSGGRSVGRAAAFEVQVVDTTGAGDVFHGAFAVGTAMGWPVERRLEFASAVAALKCTKMGGRAGIPCLDDALAFLRAHGRLDWE